MTSKKFIRAFVAGMLFPAVFLPFAYTVLYFLELHTLPREPLQFIPMYIPLLFGITNLLYIRMSDGVPVQNANIGLWVSGAILGFFVAVFGVFVLHLPTIVFGFNNGMAMLPLIILPIIYGAIFRFIVKWLNKILAV